MAPSIVSTESTSLRRQQALMVIPMRQWVLVLTLTLVSMLAMIDKNLIQLMINPIKADIGLTDVQISVLIGAAFAIANIAAGLPAGWLADRASRRGLIGAGVVVWSVATAASGLMRTFSGLFVARAAVGLGEGAIPPASYSLLHDGVAEQRRGRALAVYTMALTIGAGVALLIGGALIGWIVRNGLDRLPLVGAIRPWQLALVIIGVAGLPASLLTMLLPRVVRTAHAETGLSTYRMALGFIRRNARVLMPLMLYSISHAMLMQTMGSWMPAFIGRRFGLAPQQIGPILGLMLIVCGPAGLMICGSVMDRLNARGLHGAAIVGFVGALIFAAAGTMMPHVGSLALFWPIEAVVLLATTPFLVVTAEIVGRITPSHMVGKVMAIFLFLQAVLGQAVAPTLTAMLGQYVFAGRSNSLGDAISASAAAMGIVGVAMITLVWRGQARRERRLS